MRKLILCLICLGFSGSLFGQKAIASASEPCIDQIPSKAKYMLISVSDGEELQFYVEVKSTYQTDENISAVAAEFRKRYCNTTELRVIYFANKRLYLRRDPRNIETHPLAIFYFGRRYPEQNGITRYEVINGKVVSKEIISK